MSLEVLRDVLSSDYKGPKAIFSEVHVLKAILVIGAEGSVGRGRLGSLIGLGQGEVRTLIRRLKEKNLVLIQPDGCRLSRKGEKEFQLLNQRIPWAAEVRAEALGLGDRTYAILVRGAGRNVKRGIEQRDAAVRVGANGALSAVFRAGRFTLPGEETDCEKDGPPELWISARAARPREGDTVIVAGGDSLQGAELGALAAAMTVLR